MRGIRLIVQDAQGRSFDALQPRQEVGDGWDLRSLRGGPMTLAYSPVHRREGDGFKIELNLRDFR